MRANTTTNGMARYLTDRRRTAQQEHENAQRTAIAEREGSSRVTEIASARGMELRRLARDPEARRAKYAADRADRDRLDAEREAARVQRAKDALKHRTEIADTTARGMNRYLALPRVE